MDSFLAFFENSALASWIRGESIDSTFVFPVVVTLHALGMGFLAGGSAAIDLRVLGVAPQVPLPLMLRFLPLLWLAFAINAVSGVLLLIAYPTKGLTNPLFYAKMGLIVLALWLVQRIGAVVLRAPDQKAVAAKVKAFALASLACWVVVIAAGRLLAYTHRWEMLGVRAVPLAKLRGTHGHRAVGTVHPQHRAAWVCAHV